MGIFIFVIFGIYVLYLYPQAILIAGLILAGIWLYSKYEVVEREKEVADKTDDMDGWTAEKAADKWVDEHLDKDVLESEEFKKKSSRIAKAIKERQQEADEEMKRDIEAEDRGEKTPFAQKPKRSTAKKVEKSPKTPTKAPIVQPKPEQELTDQEIYDIMQQQNNE